MKIAICEDSVTDAGLLKGHVLEHYGSSCTIEIFPNEIEFLENFKPGCYDIIFMDIYLVNEDGISVCKAIRQTDDNCLIVFVTTSPDHAIEAFQVNAAHYIKKPICADTVTAALRKCDKLLAKRLAFIPVKAERAVRKVYLSELIYVEVAHNTCRLVMKSGEIRARQTMSELEKLIRHSGGGTRFIRCHQSYLVNMDYITEVKNNCFVMENGDIATIRRHDRSAIKSAFEEFLFAKT